MAALVERIVRKIADTAPLESSIEHTVSNLVASVLEKTANKLARFEVPAKPDVEPNDAL